MSTPSTLTITFLSYSAATPAVVTTSTQTIPIPTTLQTAEASGIPATGMGGLDAMLAAISKHGGAKFTDAAGNLTFIPLATIVKIVAS
jgi:hypothetical protein